MFGMGFTEILMIAIVAIIFLGPDKLPQFLIDVAKFFRSFKRAVTEAKEHLEQEVRLSELKEEALEYKEKFSSITQDMSAITAELEEDPLEEAEEIKKTIDSSPKKKERKKKSLQDKIDDDKDKVNV